MHTRVFRGRSICNELLSLISYQVSSYFSIYLASYNQGQKVLRHEAKYAYDTQSYIINKV